MAALGFFQHLTRFCLLKIHAPRLVWAAGALALQASLRLISTQHCPPARRRVVAMSMEPQQQAGRGAGSWGSSLLAPGCSG